MPELRVLVCDDDDLSELMLQQLGGMGIKLDRAADGAAAQAWIEENSDARFTATQALRWMPGMPKSWPSGTKSTGPLWVLKSKNRPSKGSHLCLK